MRRRLLAIIFCIVTALLTSCSTQAKKEISPTLSSEVEETSTEETWTYTAGLRRLKTSNAYIPMTSWYTTGHILYDSVMSNAKANYDIAYTTDKESINPTQQKALNRLGDAYNNVSTKVGYMIIDNLSNYEEDPVVYGVVCGNAEGYQLVKVFQKSEMVKYCPSNMKANDMSSYLTENLIFEDNTKIDKSLVDLYKYIYTNCNFDIEDNSSLARESPVLINCNKTNRTVTISDIN